MTNEVVEFAGVRITESATFPPAPISGRCYFYVTLNAEISLLRESSDDLQQMLQLPQTRVSVDGQWILWALRRKYPSVRLEKLSGSDLIYRLADHCNNSASKLLLLGGAQGSNANAVRRLLERFPYAVIAGYSPPLWEPGQPIEEEVRRQIRERISSFKPQYIICGLGAPKEQAWAWPERDWLDKQGVNGTFFFGGAIDFVSGSVRRAPVLWQRVGLEGLYRVIQQPKRFMRLIKVLRVLPLIATGRY